jgi:peroxiredoxin
VAKRIVRLAEKEIELVGECPQVGDRISPNHFSIPPARCAIRSLQPKDLLEGLVFVSTLPNISKHACAAQILGLEEEVRHREPDARLVHISADAPKFWVEVDLIHPNLTAEGYSLFGADDDSSDAFKKAFGVGVVGSTRIAHGLFSMKDGVVLAAEIPYQQMGVPSIGRFMHRALSSGAIGPSCACPH